VFSAFFYLKELAQKSPISRVLADSSILFLGEIRLPKFGENYLGVQLGRIAISSRVSRFLINTYFYSLFDSLLFWGFYFRSENSKI